MLFGLKKHFLHLAGRYDVMPANQRCTNVTGVRMTGHKHVGLCFDALRRCTSDSDLVRTAVN